MPVPPNHWFQSAVIYQIYPRSFYDTNNDGIGDLKGIITKLDYLNGTAGSLGVNAIWLSPFYPSPMADFGYDVADYCQVDPVFGTLDDFKDLVAATHKRGMKLIIDFVPNHSSDQHPWFKEARASLDNPKRDWYIWRKPKPDGSAPNNWQSAFGGSAWELDPHTNQYYLHSFLDRQPDLNWDNPEVRKAMQQVMRFWLDLGVDGLRVDAVYWLSKDRLFRDDPLEREPSNPASPYDRFDHLYSREGPHLYEYLQEMAEVVGSYPDRFMITEAYPDHWNNTASYLKFYEQVDPTVCAPFNFEGIFAPWKAADFKAFIDRFQGALKPGYIPVYSLGNHDRSRLATRLGPESAREAAILLLSLPGMPNIYYGDELGMVDVVMPPNEVKDSLERNIPGKGLGRDPQRTPLLWNNQPNAGFSSHTPWLPVDPGFAERNIATQTTDPHSMLNLYRQMIRLRNTSDALRYGSYRSLDIHPEVFCFVREHKAERLAIIINFSGESIDLTTSPVHGTTLLSTATFAPDSHNPTVLQPREARIVTLA